MISELLGNNKQLLDEVEHDIMNYQCQSLSYLPRRNPNSIIVLLYILR